MERVSFSFKQRLPIERPAPAIMDRTMVSRSFADRIKGY